MRSTSCSNPLNLPRIPHPPTLSVCHSLFINSFVLRFHPLRKKSLPQMLTSFFQKKTSRTTVVALELQFGLFLQSWQIQSFKGKISIPHWAHNGVGETQALQNTWAWHSHLEMSMDWCNGRIRWHGYNVKRCLQGYLPRNSGTKRVTDFHVGTKKSKSFYTWDKSQQKEITFCFGPSLIVIQSSPFELTSTL